MPKKISRFQLVTAESQRRPQWQKKDLTIRHGFEMPKSTSEEAQMVFALLKQSGCVIYEHDDGPTLLIRLELENICGAIGVPMFKETYRLILMTESFEKSQTVKGA